LGTLLPPEDYIRADPENAIIYSPHTYCLYLPEFSFASLSKIIKEIEKDKVDENNDLEKIRRYLGGFTAKDKDFFEPASEGTISRHDIRNTLGPAILLQELVKDIDPNDPLLKEWEEAKEDIRVKKISYLKDSFLGGMKIEGEIPTSTLQACRGRFIFIDDQHDKGWSYAIWRGLMKYKAKYEVVYDKLKREQDPFILCDSLGNCQTYNEAQSALSHFKNSSDCLLCISNEAAALEFFGETKSEVDKNLAEAEKNPNEIKRILEQKLIPLIDLVFLDARLEKDEKKKRFCDMGGAKVLEKIKKEINPSIPVILFTASERAGIYKEAIESGADNYWVKCINSGKELHEMTKNCLEKGKKLISLGYKIKLLQRINLYKQYFWDKAQSQYMRRPPRYELIDIREVQPIYCLPLLKSALRLLSDTFFDFPGSQEFTRIVVVLMAIIQEIRHKCISKKISPFRDIETLKYYNIPHAGWEVRMRRIRKDAVHEEGLISQKAAMECINWTLDILLGI
jgi:CheY-like chemotaxis protein